MMAVAWRENKPKPEENKEIYPVSGQNGKIITVALDDLWNEKPRRNERI
jgi:hypothetical protein